MAFLKLTLAVMERIYLRSDFYQKQQIQSFDMHLSSYIVRNFINSF